MPFFLKNLRPKARWSQALSSFRRWCRYPVPTGLLLLALSSCTQKGGIPLLPGELPETQVDFQLEPGDQPGQYRLTGEANFPNSTELNLLAVRLLEHQQTDAAPKLTYSVLDYQVVTVEEGTWQGDLALWQQATDGSWKETWQLDQSALSLQVEPVEDVVFLATFTPIDQLTTLEGILVQQGLQLSSALLRTTAEGQRYLHMEKTLPLPLPSDMESSERPAPHNGGWGTRYLLIEEPPMPYQVEFPDERQSDRPATVDEFLY